MYKLEFIAIVLLYSNTTNVKVKLSSIALESSGVIYSNTTNVKVKLCDVYIPLPHLIHSNTTNVKVKRSSDIGH